MTVQADRPILLVATTNEHKRQEYAQILANLPLRLSTLTDLGIHEDVEETGATFLENARLKAQAYRAATQGHTPAPWVLADDSGLEVDALGGAPGIFSTRWAGPATTAAQRNTLLLERLHGVPPAERGARFRCVIVLISPDGEEWIGDGTVEGRIAIGPRRQPGGSDFGYDPIFELPDRGLTFGEMPLAEKETISHRGRAGQQIRTVVHARLG